MTIFLHVLTVSHSVRDVLSPMARCALIMAVEAAVCAWVELIWNDTLPWRPSLLVCLQLQQPPGVPADREKDAVFEHFSLLGYKTNGKKVTDRHHGSTWGNLLDGY